MSKYHDFTVEPISLDEKDKAILEELHKDCRETLTNISRRTGIPVDTIRYRIDRMKEQEVFEYAVIVNPLKLGYPIFNALYLQLTNFTQAREEQLRAYIQKHPHLVYSAKVMGKYDFVVGIVAQNMLAFNAISNEFRTAFEDIIKDFDVLSVIDEFKYDYLMDLMGDKGN